MKKFWYSIVILILLGIGLYAFTVRTPLGLPPKEAKLPTDISTLPIFRDGLQSVGIELDNLGYHAFSPDGKYFIFTGINQKDEPPASTYLVDLKTGEARELPGIMLRGFEDSRIISLFEGTNLVLYDPASHTSETLPTDGNIYAGTLSPDGTKYVFDSLEGIKLYDRKTKEVSVISSSQYDGASTWLADNKRLLGFKDTGKSLLEAGNARQFGIWDIKAKTFSPLAEGNIPAGTVRNVTWIDPYTVARVNAGWDDGSYDYLYNMKSGEVLDLGDTSSALFGGLKEDPGRKFFVILRGEESPERPPSATLYKGMEKVASANLSTGYARENVQIIDENSLLYIRKRLSRTVGVDKADLVRLDIKTGTETVLREFPGATYASYIIVSLAPDHKTWVASSKDQFLIGSLSASNSNKDELVSYTNPESTLAFSYPSSWGEVSVREGNKTCPEEDTYRTQDTLSVFDSEFSFNEVKLPNSESFIRSGVRVRELDPKNPNDCGDGFFLQVARKELNVETLSSVSLANVTIASGLSGMYNESASRLNTEARKQYTFFVTQNSKIYVLQPYLSYVPNFGSPDLKEMEEVFKGNMQEYLAKGQTASQIRARIGEFRKMAESLAWIKK